MKLAAIASGAERYVGGLHVAAISDDGSKRRTARVQRHVVNAQTAC